MAIFYFQAGQTFAGADQTRAIVGMPIGLTGTDPNYYIQNEVGHLPLWSGLQLEMTGRYIHAGVTEWENRSCTGVNS